MTSFSSPAGLRPRRAIEASRARCHQRTALLPALNGIQHLAVLKEKFGEGQVLGSVAQIAVTLDAGR